MYLLYFSLTTLALKELLPEILQHLGPKQFGILQEILKVSDKKPEEIKEENNEDEIPSLNANSNFEEVSKVD